MNKYTILIIIGLFSLAGVGLTVWAEESVTEENPETIPATVTAKPVAGKIDLAELGELLESGQARAVAARLSGNMDRISRKNLPAALLMLGKAQLQAGEGDRKMLIRAGLNLMWVYAEFPLSRQAPEALFNAAEVNRKLGQSVAAELALRQIILQYSDGRYDSWSQKAKTELSKSYN